MCVRRGETGWWAIILQHLDALTMNIHIPVIRFISLTDKPKTKLHVNSYEYMRDTSHADTAKMSINILNSFDVECIVIFMYLFLKTGWPLLIR